MITPDFKIICMTEHLVAIERSGEVGLLIEDHAQETLNQLYCYMVMQNIFRFKSDTRSNIMPAEVYFLNRFGQWQRMVYKLTDEGNKPIEYLTTLTPDQKTQDALNALTQPI